MPSNSSLRQYYNKHDNSNTIQLKAMLLDLYKYYRRIKRYFQRKFPKQEKEEKKEKENKKDKEEEENI